ncbi:hypothetical protein KP509_35G051100 [Ceratopteris richardii]|nr:hypothetical protein KP509_35G051100 [Ceratopteris richardii]
MATCQTTALVNVLHRVMSVEDVQGRHTAVLQKLKSDLEDVVRHVVELQSSHASTLKEVSSSLQKFKEQMVICRRKEREKMQLSVLQLRQEMEEEKNTCRILKLKNKKLAEELSTANRASEDACEALERERKAREMLEEVCNELAREIGKDKAEVEILKQEQEESRKRLEEELKVMRMAVLWQDEVVKNGNTSEISGRVSEDNDKQFVPVREELRSKLEAFMEAFGTCRSKSDLGIMDRQAEQSRLYSQAFQLVDLAASGKSENEDGEAGPKACPANDSSCSNACSSGQENASHVIGIEQNGDAADILQHGAGKYSDQGKISFSSKNQRSWRSRCAIRNRTQRRYGFSQEGSEEWGNTDTSDLQSSEDDFENQMQLTNYYNCTLEMRQKDKDHDCIVNVSSDLVRNHVSSHGGRLSETPSSNHSGLTKESYCPSDKFAKSSGSSHFGIGRHTNSVSGLETDMATSIPRDQYEDDAMSCLMKGAASKGEQNNTVRPPREQDEGSRVGKIQDCSMYPHNNDLDLCSGPVGSSISVHPELNRSRQRSENRTANLGTKDLQNNTEGAWLQDANENAMRRASSITSLTFFGSPERNKIKADANASYYDHGSKTSSWHSSPAKSLLQPQIWLPSADSFSSFGGSTKCSSLNIEEEQREVTNSSSVHPFSHSQESSASKETANEQQSLCIKGNSLGAHLIKAREPEDELKPVKSLFRSSPLRRTILYD